MVLLQEVSGVEAIVAEGYWIDYCEKKGARLLNGLNARRRETKALHCQPGDLLKLN